jgi:predicted GH43/DUF377 family glycosyl hydrolase
LRPLHRPRRTRLVIAATAALCAVLVPLAASALVRFDFEQKYFVHPGRQVWDFSLVRADSMYHIFYHTILPSTPSSTQGDTIWHAASPDLRRWDVRGPVLTATPGKWDQGALWAPCVVRDDENDRWVMLYTGSDPRMNQRIGLATSVDLEQWTRLDGPVITPDTTQYVWSSNADWSNFRDPFLYRADGLWHVLITALMNMEGHAVGVLYHATSPDLLTWTDVGPLFANDSANASRVLESPQYHVIGNWHHLLFGEFYQPGITLLSATDPANWTMNNRVTLDSGNAPEVNEFDPGIRIFSRIAAHQLPQTTNIGYAVRLDTLRSQPDGSGLSVWRPHPLDEEWEARTGSSTLGNPIFGDNPRYRGEPTSGLVGHGYYGSRDYYPGPLSGRGAPGAMLGDAATGNLESRPFTVTGNSMRLLVGGGDFPATCYVALVDADDGTILLSETGGGNATMTQRQWDLTPYRGRLCRIVIVDQTTAAGGYINVDEIVEENFYTAAAPLPRAGVLGDLHLFPNPANPAVEIRFELERPARVTVTVHDVAGRLVWSAGERAYEAGPQALSWRGHGRRGEPAAAGTYLVRARTDDGAAVTARLTLLK